MAGGDKKEIPETIVVSGILHGGRYRTRFAFLPAAKIKVRLRQAVAGNARPRCIQMGSSPKPTEKKKNH